MGSTTTGSGKDAHEKVLRLAREKRERERIANSKYLNLLDKDENMKKEKLEYEINNLENTILNCKHDLGGLFRGNKTIERKKILAEEQLNIKLAELEKIKLNEMEIKQ